MRKHSKPKENVARKREKGGPGVAADLLVALRLPIETRQAVLAWGKDQPGQPNLSEAIRRLIDIGLGSVSGTPGKIPQGPSGEPDGKALGAGPPTASEQPPKGTTESLTVKGEQATREVKWTPRIVEATPSSAPARPTTTLEAQPATKPLEDNHSYQMPEDFGAFNEYWTRAQKRLGRQLTYEEVIVLFNQDRQTSKNI
ncbi:MAG TPA: hypothetical protein VKC66_01905 [Xanthobacteraceae bacterium]|nr:hypothetical protein [Xanthobacteraceae bacterium]